LILIRDVRLNKVVGRFETLSAANLFCDTYAHPEDLEGV